MKINNKGLATAKSWNWSGIVQSRNGSIFSYYSCTYQKYISVSTSWSREIIQSYWDTQNPEL